MQAVLESTTDMQPVSYQLCFQPTNTIGFQGTGVVATFQNKVSGISIDGSNSSMTNAPLFLGTNYTITLVTVNDEEFLKGSFILSGKSCISDNTGEPGLGSSGYLSVTSRSLDIGKNLLNWDVLPPLTYHLCLLSNVEGWIATGLSVTTQDFCVSTPPGIISAKQSNTFQGALNAVHLYINIGNVALSNNNLIVTGLTGSLTEDNPRMYIEGNTIYHKNYEFWCSGLEPYPACTVALSGYRIVGQQLLELTASVFVKCTDFNGPGETVAVDIVSKSSLPQHFQGGPWNHCISSCQNDSTVINDVDISSLADFEGSAIQINISAPSSISYFNCSGPILQARVVFTATYAKLGSSILYGSWSRENGVLVIPFINTIASGPWISISTILQNPMSSASLKFPSINLCYSDGLQQHESLSGVSNSGLLQATQSPTFTYAHLSTSSSIPGVLNRLSLSIGSDVSIPDPVDISVTGLLGMRTVDSALLGILNGSAKSFQYDCAQNGPRTCLAIIDINSVMVNLHRATLNVEVYCSDFASLNKKISAIWFCSTLQNSTCLQVDYDCQAGFDSTIGCRLPNTAYASGPWQECGVCQDTTRQVVKSYDITQLANSENGTIYMQLEVSSAVSAVNCYSPLGNSSVSVKALVSVSAEFSETFGSWHSQDGILVLRPTPEMKKCAVSALNCTTQLNFSFELENPFSNTEITPTIHGSGGSLTFQSITLPSINLVTSSKFSFLAATITGSNLQLNEANSISVEIRSPVPILNGTILTIKGLISNTPSAICNAISSASCSNPGDCIYLNSDQSCQWGLPILGNNVGVAKSASWDQATGTLLFAVDQSFQGFVDLSFSFVLLNPGQVRASTVASISASLIGESSESYWDWIQLSGTVLSGVSADMDLSTTLIKPQILSAQLSDSSNIVGQDNVVSIKAVANVDIAAGSTVMIAGLSTMTSNRTVWGSTAEDLWIRINGTSVLGRWQGLLGYDGSLQQYYPSWLCGPTAWTIDETTNMFGAVLDILEDESWCFVPFPFSVTTVLGKQIR